MPTYYGIEYRPTGQFRRASAHCNLYGFRDRRALTRWLEKGNDDIDRWWDGWREAVGPQSLLRWRKKQYQVSRLQGKQNDMLKTGLLFQLPQRYGLAEQIGKATKVYREKYHADPNVCHVHPDTLKEGLISSGAVLDGVTVLAIKGTLANCLFIGIDKGEMK